MTACPVKLAQYMCLSLFAIVCYTCELVGFLRNLKIVVMGDTF